MVLHLSPAQSLSSTPVPLDVLFETHEATRSLASDNHMFLQNDFAPHLYGQQGDLLSVDSGWLRSLLSFHL